MIDTAPSRRRAGSGAATSTCRRRTRTCSTSSCPRSRGTTPRSSTWRSTSRDPRDPALVHLAAGDRPARAEEHGAAAGGVGLHRQPVRDRHEPAVADPGLPLRPLEGPAGRHRRLPRGQADASGRAARARGLDGARRPEGWDFYNQTVAYAGEDPDIFVLSNLNNVGSVEVNAFQVYSAALIQKSIREGFGLTVSEGLWKARPVVAGRVGGIVTQIEHGVTGWLVDSSTECADACLEILDDPGRRARGGIAREGARAQALPDAAVAARLARPLQPPARLGGGSVERRARGGCCARGRDNAAPQADRRLQPRSGHVWARRVGRESRGGAAAAS